MKKIPGPALFGAYHDFCRYLPIDLYSLDEKTLFRLFAKYYREYVKNNTNYNISVLSAEAAKFVYERMEEYLNA